MTKYFDLLETRNDLREKKWDSKLTEEEAVIFKKVSFEFKQYLVEVLDRKAREVQQVRDILDKYRDRADIFLGGVPMIVTDMIGYIESDLSIFGIAVTVLMVLVMWLFFRSKRWVLLPMLNCVIVVWVMVGALGWLDWRVTVISSNFVSILIIITLSLTIHLIVRYGELYAQKSRCQTGRPGERHGSSHVPALLSSRRSPPLWRFVRWWSAISAR